MNLLWLFLAFVLVLLALVLMRLLVSHFHTRWVRRQLHEMLGRMDQVKQHKTKQEGTRKFFCNALIGVYSVACR